MHILVARSALLVHALALTGFVIGTLVTLCYMTCTASREVSAGYAVRQVLLALILMPVCFWGLLVVPLMVESDIIKWRLPNWRLPADEA